MFTPRDWFAAGDPLDNTRNAEVKTTSYIDSVVAHADATYADAIRLLNTMGQFATFTPIDTSTGWTDVSLPAINTYDLGALPVKPTLDNIDDPAINFTYTEDPYVSSLLTALKAKLLSDINLGGIGLSSAVENEIYDREEERDVRQLSDEIDRISTRWSESGFSMPDGVLTAMTSWANIEYQNKKSDKSRKIAEDSEKLGIENIHFTIEQSTKLEDVLMRYNAASNKNKIDAATAIMEAGIKIFEAQVRKNLADVDLYKAEAQAYEANANALGAIAKVDVSLYEAQTNYNVARSNILVKEIDLQIKQLEVQLNITNDIAKATADVASRLAAGSMSAVNASASIGWSGSDSNSFSLSHSYSKQSSGSESISENTNHNLSE
jgi:hypothetical protein